MVLLSRNSGGVRRDKGFDLLIERDVDGDSHAEVAGGKAAPRAGNGNGLRGIASDGDPSKTDVTIASDKKVEFQHFVQVMDACQKAGVSNIGIAADTPN